MHSGTSRLARRIQTRQRTPPMRVCPDSTHQIVRSRPHRNPVPPQLQPIPSQELRDPRKPRLQINVLPRLAHVEIHRALHLLAPDRPRHHVPWSQLQPLVVALHKPLSALVHQPCTLAAQGLAHQKVWRALQRKRRRMELEELHVHQLRPCPVRHRDAVARSHRRVCRIAVDLPCAAAGQQHRPRPHLDQFPSRIQQRRPHHAPVCQNQVHRHRPLHQLHALQPTHMPQQRLHNLPPRRIPIGMKNPRQAVRALPRSHQLARPSRALPRRMPVEPSAPPQQLPNAPWPLLHQHRRSLGVHQPIAGRNRVRQMQRHVLRAAHRHGDPALRIRRIRFLQALLRHQQNTARLSQPHRRAQPGNPSAHH